MKRNRRILLIVLAVSGLCILCVIGGAIYNATPAGQLALTESAQTEEARPTNTTRPTNTPRPPTNTPRPSNTPAPTNTPRPTNTATPLPEPILIEGRGDQVIEVNKWDGPAIARIIYSGGSNFAIWQYDSLGNRFNLLVNTIGSYQGIRPLDFRNDEVTARLEIESSGDFTIEILPVQEATHLTVPGVYQGVGDDVLILEGGRPDLINADASTAQSNFAIWAFGSSGIDLIFNEIAPYQGQAVLSGDTFILEIEATGAWMIEITSR